MFNFSQAMAIFTLFEEVASVAKEMEADGSMAKIEGAVTAAEGELANPMAAKLIAKIKAMIPHVTEAPKPSA